MANMKQIGLYTGISGAWGTEVYVYMAVTLVNGKVESKSH